jgi:hypothetical protein
VLHIAEDFKRGLLKRIHNIFRTEAVHHLRQREPIAEPLALGIFDTRGGLQEYGDRVRAGNQKKEVALDGGAQAARLASLKVDDHETTKELPNAASRYYIPQHQVSNAGEQILWRSERAVIEQSHGDEYAINQSGKQTSL